MKRAMIAMSGGVDSAVAALLMKEAGYDCIGATMRLHDYSGSCGAASEAETARRVAETIGIPFEIFDFSRDFDAEVISPFAAAYDKARTPNPCVFCNRALKFGKLFEKARALGCDLLVTGHYARTEERNGVTLLKKALDPGKDQSYVLYGLTQKELPHLRFPLGGMTKSEVRAIAEAHGFENAQKPDSQDICFVPDGDYASFVASRLGKTSEEGDFVSADGKILGRHKGLIHYTVGQRKGLGIAAATPLYVLSLRPENNTVVLGQDADLFLRSLHVENVTWTAGAPTSDRLSCAVRIRYRHTEQPAVLTLCPDGSADVLFDEPQRAATPGQSAVFYDGETILGGGIIAFASSTEGEDRP